MEIAITKANGKAKGTIGWLIDGLKTRTLQLTEGTLKSNGHHGLWLKGENLSQFLASYDQYANAIQAGIDVQYSIVADEIVERGPWTDCSWDLLMDIAQQWCDDCNEILEAEIKPEISIIRVGV